MLDLMISGAVDPEIVAENQQENLRPFSTINEIGGLLFHAIEHLAFESGDQRSQILAALHQINEICLDNLWREQNLKPIAAHAAAVLNNLSRIA